jgi:hypothetical protein
MFLGDQLLFDITPNISFRARHENALGQYLQSLQKLKKYDVTLPLVAHRENSGNYHVRIDELLGHHELRLQSLVDIIRENPGINGYEAASKRKWSIRARGWKDFPPGQKWFAVCEALSHIDYLIHEGRVGMEEHDGVEYYRVVEQAGL